MNKINASKTNFMVFNKPHAEPVYHLDINSQPISSVNHFKLLGLIVDNKLNWKEHLNHVSGKISRGLFALWRVKHYESRETLTNLYYMHLKHFDGVTLLFEVWILRTESTLWCHSIVQKWTIVESVLRIHTYSFLIIEFEVF